MGVRSFEHVGITVTDMDSVVDFFVLLGFTASERAHVGGSWADRVNGLSGTDVEMVFLSPPDGSGSIEVSQFKGELALELGDALPANVPGLRHLAYRVDHLHQLLEQVQAAGYKLIGEAVNYEDIWLVAYVRGPEGLIIELGERLNLN